MPPKGLIPKLLGKRFPNFLTDRIANSLVRLISRRSLGITFPSNHQALGKVDFTQSLMQFIQPQGSIREAAIFGSIRPC